jgi:hypothetical protein
MLYIASMIALFIFCAYNLNHLCCLILGIHPGVNPHGEIHPDVILHFGIQHGEIPPFGIPPFGIPPFGIQPFGIHWGLIH